MAQDQSALHDLLEVLRTAEGGQFVNRLLTGALQALIELEATAVIGAAPHERTPTRTTQRNGSPPKTLTTAAGDVTVFDPEDPDRLVLSLAARTTPAPRPGAVRRHRRDLRPRRVHTGPPRRAV